MTSEEWDTLSAWLNAWLAADATGRQRLRAQLAAEQPELVAEAEALAAAGGQLSGFLETPALVAAAHELAQEDAVISPGAAVGPYRVVNFLARGGMGDVYRATDVRLRRNVALKVLAESRTDEPRRLERFMHEARVTASLDHPNVVRVYDVGRYENRAYLVAELLEGETLRTRIARGPIDPDEVLRIGVEVARGLVAAHAAGLVHRDLKPENIFLTQSGTTKLLDFGIAKLAQDEAVPSGFSTLTGVVLGTAGYLAPEQITGEDVDARADLFSFGAVLFEMLTGTRAFAREHLVETLHAILHDSPPDVFAERPDVPPSLAGLIWRLLEKAPEARFQSSADLLDALQHVHTAGVDFDAVNERRPRSTTGWRWPDSTPRARRIRWAAAVALCAIVIAASTVAWYSQPPSEPVAGGTTSVTLAIMPFRSIPAGGDDLLELGLADILISRLGQLSEVGVLPLTATERRRARDPRDAARELGATHVLTGLLQRDTGKVRATVHLLSVSDDRAIWTTSIDADSSNAFSVQDVIVTRVIDEFAPRLTAGARRRLAEPGTRNNDAFEAYLNGRADVGKPTRVELMRAVTFFQQAVKLDPGYTDAWAGLATAYMRMPIAGDARPGEAFAEAKRAASRALELDPAHAEAQSVLGAVAFWHEWDYARAERLVRSALELQPSSVSSQVTLAHLLSNIGRHGEALTEIRRARALDPTWAVARSLEGQFLFMARQYNEALAHMDTMLENESNFSAGHTMRAYPLLALGRYEEAIREFARAGELSRREDSSARPYSWHIVLHGYALARMGRRRGAATILDQLRSQAREQYVPPHHEALLLHALGRDDEALERLRAAVDGRDIFATFLGVDPKWDALRASPAFRELVSRVNLLDASDRARSQAASITP